MSFNPHIDDRTHNLLMTIHDGATLEDAFRRLTVSHASLLRELGDVRVHALDPCPRCTSRVIASETEARCAAGCGWTYRRHGTTT